MRIIPTIILDIACLLYASVVTAQIIPEDRIIEWNAGVPGGIPVISSPTVNILDFHADPTGKSDCHEAFTSAMRTLHNGQGIIYLPAGTYRFAAPVMINRNGVVIRGDGPEKTRLLMDFSSDCFRISTHSQGEWQILYADLPKGSREIIVPDVSVFKADEFAEIEQDNDTSVMYTRPEWNQSWSENSVGQLFAIERVTSNAIILKTGTHIAFQKRLRVRIRPQRLISHVGFEDLYVEKMQAGGHTFNFQNAAYCWISNIESHHTRKAHVTLNTAIGCEVRDSYLHHSFDYGGGGSGYGVDCAHHATDNLIENNIFNHLRHAMMVQTGANGNVFGYNYSINTVQGTGETGLNNGWIPPDISVHGHFPFMNLFEGNDVQEMGIADYWGPAGPGNTFLRNRVAGEGIFLYDHSHHQNLLGNITRFITNEWNSSKFLILQGNMLNNAVQWNNAIMDRKIPDSFYRKQAPAFFIGGAWPVAGPDVPAGSKLPAQIRYERQSGT